MKTFLKHALIICILFIFSPISAHSANIGQLGLEAFRMDIGARPLSLGEAFAGVSNDENSCFYNPGGLPWSKGVIVSAKDINNLAAVQAYPTGYGTTLGVGIVASRTSNYITPTAQIADLSNTYIILSSGTKLNAIPILGLIPTSQNFGLGANLKIMFAQTLRVVGLSDSTSTGYEADLGGFYKALPWLSFGINARNFLPSGGITWNNIEKEAIPVSVRYGLGAKLIGDVNSPIYLEGNEVTFSMDFDSYREKQGAGYVGAEWRLKGALSLRSGYFANSKASGLSLGAGIKIEDWGIDIASYTDEIKNERAVSLSVLYDPKDWFFEIKKPTTVYGQIKIKDPIFGLSPSDETTTYEDFIAISGTAKPNVIVKVNNEDVVIDKDGKFNAMMNLNPGKNLIFVDVFLGDGKKSYGLKVFKKAKVVIAEEKSLEKQLKSSKPKDIKAINAELQKVKDRKEKVEALVTLGIIDVEPNTEFKLAAPIKRGELSSWLVKAAGIPLPRVTQDVFPDVPMSNPYAPFIKAAVDANLMQAKGGKFYPDAPVSKTEAEQIFKRFGVIK